jgi:hypothetical protein
MAEPLLKLHTDSNLLIRRATPADRDTLLGLSQTVFTETGTDKVNELTPEFWDWQFLHQPSNRFCVWVAEIDGQIVGQHPTNVIRVKWNNRELLSCVVIDLMVLPEHRKKSLFVNLGRIAQEEMSESGIGLSSGFPNKNSYPAATRFLKYKTVCQVPVLVMPMRWSRLLRKAKIPSWIAPVIGTFAAAGFRLMRWPMPSGKNVVVREVTEFPEEIDEFWEGASSAHKIISVRDRRYLVWRYCQCPTRTYRIHIAESNGKLAGYLVRRTFEKDGLKLGAIMDILVDPGRADVLNALLRSAIKAFRKEAVDALMLLMRRDSFYYSALRRHGFFRIPERFNPRTFNFVCRVHWPDLPEGELCAAQNWFVTLGDYDVY